MKFTLFVAVCGAVALTVAAMPDAGYFIPKAFYTLDADGHQSALHPVSPHTAHYLRRLRRESVSSSSSSSSTTGNDGKIYFSQRSSVRHTPDVSFSSRFDDSSESDAPSSYPYRSGSSGSSSYPYRGSGGYNGGSSSSSSSSSSSTTGSDGKIYFSQQTGVHHSPDVSFSSRFGDSSDSSSSPSGSTGHVIQTTGVINNDGRILYSTKKTNL